MRALCYNFDMKLNLVLAKILFGAALIVIPIFTFISAPQAFAANATAPINGSKGGFVICGNTADHPCQIGDLFAVFVIIINYLITMAGFVAVLAIVFAGFMMIYSQGQEQLTAAKKRFSGAIIGLVLVAAAFILINSLFAGTFSIGVCNGNSILTSPLNYIQDINSCK